MYAVHKEIRPQAVAPDQASAKPSPVGQEASTSDPARTSAERAAAALELMRQLEAKAARRSEARRALTDRCGRLTARARLAALLDTERPYLSLYNMASYLVDGPDPLRALPGAALLGGLVSWRACAALWPSMMRGSMRALCQLNLRISLLA
jgi:geranyl-CoA carboxylase beta subunit